MLMPRLRLRLINDWHQAWRWSSIRLMAVSGVLQAVLLAFPEKMAQYVPYWVMSTLATTSLAILLLAGFARITKVENLNVPEPPAPPVQLGDHGG